MKASKQIAVLFTVFALFGVRAQDEDEEDEMTHRASLTWGRVFLEGGVQHRQFFKVWFKPSHAPLLCRPPRPAHPTHLAPPARPPAHPLLPLPPARRASATSCPWSRWRWSWPSRRWAAPSPRTT